MRETGPVHKPPLAHPAESRLALKMMDYVHPMEVVQDDRLDPTEKRAILSAWASDACAVDSRPGFRWLSGTPGPILVDHVLKALRVLDGLGGLKAWEEVPALRGGEIWSGNPGGTGWHAHG